MTDSNIDASVIKKTQDILGKYVKKPHLSEKLLRKPPFRFLHDVFNAIIKGTGYFVGLYTGEELNSENIKDREGKMKFLQKMIDTIKIATNESLNVRTSKIVAGQDPEKTNELLQLIGEVIDKQLDWKSAVDMVVGDKAISTKPSTKNTSKEKSKENENNKSNEKNANKPKEKELVKESKGTSKNASPTKKDGIAKTSPLATKEKSKAETKEKSKGETKEKSKAESKEKSKGATKEKSKAETKGKKEKLSKESHQKEKTASRKSKDSPTLIEKSKQNLIKETSSPDKGTILEASSELKPKLKVRSMPQEVDEVEENFDSNINDESSHNKLTHLVSQPVPPMRSGTSEVAASPEINKKERRPKKISNEIVLTTDTQTVSDIDSSPKESGSRKSPANRRSSGRSRKSNDNKLQKDQSSIENNQQSMETVDSLKTLNEGHHHSGQLEVQAVRNSPPSTSELNTTVSAASTVKAETTFVRRNSNEFTATATIIRPRTSLRPPSARPASARPGAPRRRDKNIEIILQPNEQVKMSGISVNLQNFDADLEDDGENLVIIEDPNVGDNSESHLMMESVDNDITQQGHLVQQILETQKELVHSNNDLETRTEKEIDPTKALNLRQSSAHQMDNLRDVIQTLTKSISPFGKLMDFIPEDIDAMQLELTMWRDSYTQGAMELKKEKSLTESVTEPMKNQLIQIDANIKEYQEMVDASRTKILQNSDKILRLLTDNS